MKKPYTVQCSYPAYWAITISVEAETLDEALDKAIETANQSEGWRSIDHCGDTHVDAVCPGANADPWTNETALPVPDRFTEQGEPPIVTVTEAGRPDGGIEVTRGRVLLRFASAAGTVTAEVSDPPHPPANKPLVTVKPGPGGRPDVTVTEGRARIRILDR